MPLEHNTDLGPCVCGVIHFTCPRCGAHHDRGYVNGVDAFRCLRCGYVGHGLHPDPDIDAAVWRDQQLARRWEQAHGIDPGPLFPPGFLPPTT